METPKTKQTCSCGNKPEELRSDNRPTKTELCLLKVIYECLGCVQIKQLQLKMTITVIQIIIL